MGPTRTDVVDWLERWLGTPLTPADQADVLRATAAEAARADALIDGFAARFGVDMSGYQPLMHCRSPAQALRPDWPLPVPPPHGAIVPLSVSVLHAAAVAGRWPVRYPALPIARDVSLFNIPLLAAGLVVATLLVLWVVPRIF